MAKDSKRILATISITLLFLVSAVSVPTVLAAQNKPAALAPGPLTSLQANWASPNGNQFGQDYNPQTQINSTSVANLGLSWLFPLPTHPTALISVAGGLGVDTAPLIVNGTIYAITQYGQVFALNAANGDVIWTDVLPIRPNSTAGISGVGGLSLHLHDGAEQFTTKLFGGTPTVWYITPDIKVWAIDALTGQYELNFTYFPGTSAIPGDSPTAIESANAPNILVDQNRGIAITSVGSGSSAATGRCFYRGWNILVNPPVPLWTTFCTPPQPEGNLPVDPNWDIEQVNSMKGAQIFYPGPAYNGGGPIPGTAVVDLKTMSASQLNSTLYNDWGYVNQSPSCLAATGGESTGSTASGWGGQWLLGTGPTLGYAFVNTNNPDPYNSICTPGTKLWSASVLALNETNGNWIWGFQTSSHDEWDLDCSWWQGLGNETVNGANTQVLWKLCKNGYLYELNAVNGKMIWAYTPPISSIPVCQYCHMHNPLNQTQMTEAFMNPSLQPTAFYPGAAVGEEEASYDPALNYVFFTDEDIPNIAFYVAFNSSNYKTNPGMSFTPIGTLCAGCAYTTTSNNATLSAVNAATGQLVWSHFIATQGYRGGVTSSGNLVFLTLSSGDLLMINAQTGATVRDFFIGGPLNVLPSIGATASGQMEVIVPVTAGIVSWATAVPGDIVALTLQAAPASSVSVSTTTTTASGSVSTTTSVSVSTVTASGAVSATTAYGIAAVAVIFIIATGYLAMTRGKKPAS